MGMSDVQLRVRHTVCRSLWLGTNLTLDVLAVVKIVVPTLDPFDPASATGFVGGALTSAISDMWSGTSDFPFGG